MLDILEEIEKSGNSVNLKKEEVKIDLNFVKNEPVSQPNLSNFNLDDAFSQTQVILLCVNNESFKLSEKTFNLKICGKAMNEWVKNAVQGMEIVEAEIDSKADFLPVVKQNVGNKKYTLVLFSDAPLLQYKTVQEIVEYFVLKSLCVLKFSRGYMFETNYLNTIDKLFNPQMQYFEEEDFICCYNLKQFALVSDIMHNRILGFHQRNGVVITDPATTHIDADVSIENDVLVMPNNKLFGKCKIEKGTVLKCNNIIQNSVIKQDCTIENSNITSSVIQEKCIIQSYCTIDSSILESGCTLKGYNYIQSMKINQNTILEVFDKKE